MKRFYQKTKLLRSMLWGDMVRRGPFYVDICLTSRCNLNCLGCPYHSSHIDAELPQKQTKIDISFDLFKRLCKELKTMHTYELVLHGAGEPFLHADFSDIVATAKSEGFHVTLITNGTFLDQRRIQTLIDSGLDVLKVSLWASSKEQYQKNYPGTNPKYLDKILNGIELLTNSKAEREKRRPEVIMHHVINRINFQTIDAMVDLAHRVGCNGLTFSPLRDIHGELYPFVLSEDEERLVHHSLLQAKKRLDSLSMEHNVEFTLQRYGIGGNVSSILPCYVAWYHVRIESDGRVYPCGLCDIDFGNTHEDTFHEIWNGPAIRAFRRQAMTQEGLASLSEHCDCNFCCFIDDNLRIHRYLRWVPSLGKIPKKKSIGNEEKRKP